MAKVVNPIEQKTVKEEDLIYRLEEMHTAMQKSIENVSKVIVQQNELINVVSNSDKKDAFKEFIEESTEQLKNLNDQKQKLIDKADYLQNFLSKCEDKTFRKSANMLLVILGVFEDR